MKETFYFSHDYNARSDGKLVKVLMKHGMEGIGAYWCIIEMLYEEGGYLNIEEYERITFELRISYDLVESIINNFGLFDKDDTKFWSNSVLDRLKQRMDKSEKARISVQKRWDDKKKKDTNVLRTKNECNTIKERKGKENKVKENNIKIISEKINSMEKGTARYNFYSFLLEINDRIEEAIDTEKIDNKFKEFLSKLGEQKAVLELESFCEHHRNEKTVFKSTIGRLNTWLANKLK